MSVLHITPSGRRWRARAPARHRRLALPASTPLLRLLLHLECPPPALSPVLYGFAQTQAST